MKKEAACLRVERKFYQGVKKYQLVKPGDRVLVGLSGGKDSLALIELLTMMRKRYNYNFDVLAHHVRMANVDYKTDTTWLQEFCDHFDIPLIIKEGSFETDRNTKRSPCFLCSWTRRKLLFKACKTHNCNKLALGHHKDDIIRTTMMNLTFNGTFGTMPALLQMRKFPLTVIRPLCQVEEADLIYWANFKEYKKQSKLCPYEKASNRTSVDTLIHTMENLNPDAKSNIWHALMKSGKLVQIE